LETSGAYALNGNWDWICVSPKKNKPPLPEMLKKAHELKVIIHNQNDFEWAKQHAQCVSSECKLYLQPEWSKLKEIQMDVISFVQHNPIWKISLQTHKYLNIP
jgi:organic radical activating enzyme